TITTYDDYGDFIDTKVIENKTFDLRGRVLTQEVTNYTDENLTAYSERQEITNSDYTRHDYVGHVSIKTYLQSGELVDRQEIDNTYDEYGNAKTQVINRYDEFEALIDHKTILNTYESPLAQRKGNATHTKIRRYTSLAESLATLIERQEISNTSFDLRGNVVDQTVDRYVGQSGVEYLASREVIENLEINSRGDAGKQRISSWTCPTGVEKEGLVEISYQVITNRRFNTQHNITNQMIITYGQKQDYDNLQTRSEPLDVQEIRSAGFHSSGVALVQYIATYASLVDGKASDLLDIKKIENRNITSLGYVQDSVITRYGSGSYTESGPIVPDPSSAIDRQFIHTDKADFDTRGNAEIQSIVREYYDSGAWQFSEAQKVTNSDIDIHDRFHSSMVRTYSAAAYSWSADKNAHDIVIDASSFQDLQKISIGQAGFDVFGNVLQESIDTYSTTEVDPAGLVNHKTITNYYGGPTPLPGDEEIMTITVQLSSGDKIQKSYELAQRRGSALSSTVETYTSLLESLDTKIDKVVTTTSLFDYRGFAMDQESKTYVVDRYLTQAPDELLTERRVIENRAIDNRGDAATQYIQTYKTEHALTDGVVTSLGEVETAYQVFTNRDFDGNHNITNQMIITYGQKQDYD
ncbi:MAG: hypothetical protein QME83_19055, partial [Thermodesulfobacteriota bacterium]|nr:hypothetical protein [Thermodesulfobacteriota bacterium]